jgi:hypothetical protein
VSCEVDRVSWGACELRVGLRRLVQILSWHGTGTLACACCMLLGLFLAAL